MAALLEVRAQMTNLTTRLFDRIGPQEYFYKSLYYGLSDENGHRKRNFLKTPFSYFRVGGGKRNCSKTMMYQYWIQPTRAKENGGNKQIQINIFRLCDFVLDGDF